MLSFSNFSSLERFFCNSFFNICSSLEAAPFSFLLSFLYSIYSYFINIASIIRIFWRSLLSSGTSFFFINFFFCVPSGQSSASFSFYSSSALSESLSSLSTIFWFQKLSASCLDISATLNISLTIAYLFIDLYRLSACYYSPSSIAESSLLIIIVFLGST